MSEGTPSAAPRGRVELGLAALVVAIGGFLLVETTAIEVPATSNVVGPRFFPTVVGILMVVVGLWLGVDVLRGGRGEPDAEEDADPSRPTDRGLQLRGRTVRELQLRGRTDYRTLGLITAAFAAHVLLLEVDAGWPVAAAALFWGVAFALGSRRWVRDVALAIVVALVAYLLFSRVLGVGLPAGVLERVL